MISIQAKYFAGMSHAHGSPIALRVEVYPRRVQSANDVWLMTVVLRNTSQLTQRNDPREAAFTKHTSK